MKKANNKGGVVEWLLFASVLCIWIGFEFLSTRSNAPKESTHTLKVLDAGGMAFAPMPNAKVASASPLADECLLGRIKKERLVAISSYTALQKEGANSLPKERIKSIDDVEKLAALKVDVVIVSNMGDPSRVSRLRRAGIKVFDLGSSATVNDYLSGVRKLEALLGLHDVHERSARSISAELAAMRALPSLHKKVLYLALYGDKCYGAGRESSYGDVIDLAQAENLERRARGYPEYTTEDVVAFDADFVVSEEGMAQKICTRPPLAFLCAQKRIVEIPSELLQSTGPGILTSALLLRHSIIEKEQHEK